MLNFRHLSVVSILMEFNEECIPTESVKACQELVDSAKRMIKTDYDYDLEIPYSQHEAEKAAGMGSYHSCIYNTKTNMFSTETAKFTTDLNQ
ncbi:hypothetical protein MXB_5717, partial [Myxobolus squamalis]